MQTMSLGLLVFFVGNWGIILSLSLSLSLEMQLNFSARACFYCIFLLAIYIFRRCCIFHWKLLQLLGNRWQLVKNTSPFSILSARTFHLSNLRSFLNFILFFCIPQNGRKGRGLSTARFMQILRCADNRLTSIVNAGMIDALRFWLDFKSVHGCISKMHS